MARTIDLDTLTVGKLLELANLVGELTKGATTTPPAKPPTPPDAPKRAPRKVPAGIEGVRKNPSRRLQAPKPCPLCGKLNNDKHAGFVCSDHGETDVRRAINNRIKVDGLEAVKASLTAPPAVTPPADALPKPKAAKKKPAKKTKAKKSDKKTEAPQAT